jgi:hypothetical protein
MSWAADQDSALGSSKQSALVIMTHPLTVEYNGSTDETYPLWFNPSRFYTGAKIHLDVFRQIGAIRHDLRKYIDDLLVIRAYAAGALVLVVFCLCEQVVAILWLSLRWIPIWCILACAAYILVFVQSRYVAAFYALFWISLYTLMMFRIDAKARTAILATVLCASMIPVAWDVADATKDVAANLIKPRKPDFQLMLDQLRLLGVRPEDRLAVVGYAYDAYYIRAARAHVGAQIFNANEFWGLTPCQRHAVVERLRAIGIKAIVANKRPVSLQEAGWRDVQLSQGRRLSIMSIDPSRTGECTSPPDLARAPL